MKQLPFSAGRNWSGPSKFGRIWLTRPSAISTPCPFCGAQATFSSGDAVNNTEAETVVWRSRCPACDGTVWFFIICKPTTDESAAPCLALAMYPGEELPDAGIVGEHVPKRLNDIYQEAETGFRHKLWRSTCVSCRAVLEGIVKECWPRGQSKPSSLSSQIKYLAENGHYPESVAKLAHALRSGGNLAAHLDDVADPNQTVAAAMLSLTSFFLEFSFILPRRVEDLEQKLRSLSGEEGTSGTP